MQIMPVHEPVLLLEGVDVGGETFSIFRYPFIIRISLQFTNIYQDIGYEVSKCLLCG